MRVRGGRAHRHLHRDETHSPDQRGAAAYVRSATYASKESIDKERTGSPGNVLGKRPIRAVQRISSGTASSRRSAILSRFQLTTWRDATRARETILIYAPEGSPGARIIITNGNHCRELRERERETKGDREERQREEAARDSLANNPRREMRFARKWDALIEIAPGVSRGEEKEERVPNYSR